MSKSFLEELAEDVYAKYPQEEDLTLVFPNRRAGLFYKQNLSRLSSAPCWSPRIYSFPDLISSFSDRVLLENLDLNFSLYKVFGKVLKSKENFERFFFWGQMLLRDFDDLDKSLVNATNLYSNLSQQKQLDLYFDYLSPEQKSLIQQFWRDFVDKGSTQKERFLRIWEHLFEVYTIFQDQLRQANHAYEGMIYREIAEAPNASRLPAFEGKIIFAGFNALTPAEEKIIGWFRNHKAGEIHWDLDQYYLVDEKQEAGRFLRSYRKNRVFSSSFPANAPSRINGQAPPDITITGVPQHVGQAKLLGQRLGQLLAENPKVDLKNIVVVLADEQLLFPVLHSLPPQVDKINVTMGFPLSAAPLFTLVEHLIDLQLRLRKNTEREWLFHYKPVLNVLRHPLVRVVDGEKTNEIIKEIEKDNKVFVRAQEVEGRFELLSAIFCPAGNDLIDYFQRVILAIAPCLSEEINRSFHYHFFKILNRLKEIQEEEQETMTLQSFTKLFRQLARSERLPFTGEPLEGLQIMGVLETRNLDFEHVFVLSMNEDFFPASHQQRSYIPYNLRKAFGLPTYEHQDAIYAYLFYRLLQRAKTVNLFYNSEGNDLGGEEMSRFLQQLLYESGLPIKRETLFNSVNFSQVPEVRIDKTSAVLEAMGGYLKDGEGQFARRLTPSALNVYLDCRLKFYLRYIARLYEKNEVSDDVDAMIFGNILHKGMELLYAGFVKHFGRNEVTAKDFTWLRKEIPGAVSAAFKLSYGVAEDREFFFEGKNLIASHVIQQFMEQILKKDKAYAPFEILGLEADEEEGFTLEYPVTIEGKTRTAGLKGIIDRIDHKGEVVRVIDYKTGKDERDFETLEKLFDPGDKYRRKAVFQTFYYGLLYQGSFPGSELQITPGIIRTRDLFRSDFDYRVKQKKQYKKYDLVTDMTPYLPEFERHLQDLLQEIFDSKVPFDQTKDISKCRFCPYKDICDR